MLRRFTQHFKAEPEKVKGLRDSHPAVVEARTLFPSRVINAQDAANLLISGKNSRKIGNRVVKGAWKGMPVFTLTLEERATCPRSCAVFNTCYGNSMPFPYRHRHGPALESRLDLELHKRALRYKSGFVVRLHVLGAFYNPEYVRRWHRWFAEIPQLRVFGYTAYAPETAIGAEIVKLNQDYAGRCVIRFSTAWAQDQIKAPGILYAHTIARSVETNSTIEGLICPVQTEKTAACGSCALCWSTEKNIVFMLHGQTGQKRVRRKAKTNG